MKAVNLVWLAVDEKHTRIDKSEQNKRTKTESILLYCQRKLSKTGDTIKERNIY